jgi:hypothetical protein
MGKKRVSYFYNSKNLIFNTINRQYWFFLLWRATSDEANKNKNGSSADS